LSLRFQLLPAFPTGRKKGWTQGPHGFAVRTARHFRRNIPGPVDEAGNLLARRTFQRRSSARGFGLTESNPPCPKPFAHDAAASTASPAREHDDHKIAPQDQAGMRDTYAISEFRSIGIFLQERVDGSAKQGR